MSVIAAYFEKIEAVYATGEATEHSYRPALEFLFRSLDETLSVINEPKRSDYGAPDFIFQRDGVPIGYCEAKDIDKDLTTLKGYSVEQKKRYLAGFPNLLYTNGVDFEFYRDETLIRTVSIGEFLMGIQPKTENFEALEHQLASFLAERPRTITSSKRLAGMMAAKAVLIKDVLGRALVKDLKDREDTDLTSQLQAFQKNLIHDITAADFADIYAETIAYGMFAARLHDETLDTFSRAEALELLPKTNPFLRSLFSYIAGPDLDDRSEWIIDDLAKIFLACDLREIMADFGQMTGQNDPFLHFYETFLAAYNPAKRKARGVWYTPEPVVNFIVRAVDEVLQTEFGLADGLADTSKVTIDFDTGQVKRNQDGTLSKRGARHIEKKEVHKVQILDPATGTGTFLAEVIKQIGAKVKTAAPGHWSQYVEEELIPRVHGFELLMASYAMCHMKLDMILTEMGYKPSGKPPRLSVYLTNSLEEGEPVEQSLFAQWLAREAKEANTIKNDMPIMCVIGNPPYSGVSQNMGHWITSLIEDYKYVDGEHFGERKHWLHDDYVKFIRLAEHMVEKNGEGVVGFITNHGYLDNPTFRGMRWHLMRTFDRINVLDLHGNMKKKEVSPDRRPDRNIFDIQQGVSIIIAVKKTKSSTGLAEVHHGDLWGARETKYSALNAGKIGQLTPQRLNCTGPQFAFVRRDHALTEEYAKGISLTKLMPENVTGIVTARDGLVIDFTLQELIERIQRFVDPKKNDAKVRAEFFPNKKSKRYPPGDTRGWKLSVARTALQASNWKVNIQPISYRPFDIRKILYRSDMVDWGRFNKLPQISNKNNFALIFSRQAVSGDGPPVNIFVSGEIFDNRGVYSNKGISQAAPLYLYPDEDSLDQTRRVNFDPKFYKKIRELAAHPEHGEPDEVAVFDYIYGVLHSPDYRETYAEFLKVDFPRIAWPASPDVFWHVREKGERLRRLHLMELAVIGETPYPFEGEGDGAVEKPVFEELKDGAGRVFINGTQSFASVPRIAWDFYIGGYQPAQKWLKDRKGRTLSFADIQHYQRIIKILTESDRIMKEIKLPLDEAA